MTEDVGPPANYVVIQASGAFEIRPDVEALACWSIEFADDSSPLDGEEFRRELMASADILLSNPQ